MSTAIFVPSEYVLTFTFNTYPPVVAVPVWIWGWGLGGVVHDKKLRQINLRKNRSLECVQVGWTELVNPEGS